MCPWLSSPVFIDYHEPNEYPKLQLWILTSNYKKKKKNMQNTHNIINNVKSWEIKGLLMPCHCNKRSSSLICCHTRWWVVRLGPTQATRCQHRSERMNRSQVKARSGSQEVSPRTGFRNKPNQEARGSGWVHHGQRISQAKLPRDQAENCI